MTIRRSHKPNRERGQTLAEFALIAPILAILIFGFIDVARLYQAWVTVQGVAREGARYGVTGREDCEISETDRAACIEYVARQQGNGLTNSATALDVTTTSWKFPSYSVENGEGQPGAQCDLIEVRVTYKYKPSTPIVGALFGGVDLSAKERMVNEPFGPCQT